MSKRLLQTRFTEKENSEAGHQLGCILVVKPGGEGKKRDWVNYNVVRGRGLSQFLESSEA